MMNMVVFRQLREKMTAVFLWFAVIVVGFCYGDELCALDEVILDMKRDLSNVMR